MNGRVYDPGLGRFLSADTIIQAPNNTQSYNRYSYVWNNPLRHTDPSGHVVFTLGAMAWAIAKGTVDWYIAAAVFGAAGFADSLMQGASLSDAFQSGLIAGAAAGAFSAIGASGMDFIAGSKEITQTLAFGTVGGITSSLQGGKFGHGFVSAGIGAAVGFSGLTKNMNMFEKALTSAVVGGTVSELTGGKFANGAATAAFASIVSEGVNAANDDGTTQQGEPREISQKEFEQEIRDGGAKIGRLSREDRRLADSLTSNEEFKSEASRIFNESLTTGETQGIRIYSVNGDHYHMSTYSGSPCSPPSASCMIPQRVVPFRNWKLILQWHPHPTPGLTYPSSSDYISNSLNGSIGVVGSQNGGTTYFRGERR